MLWRDADGDRDSDAFTCRVRIEEGEPLTQFLWFGNPGGQVVPFDGYTLYVNLLNLLIHLIYSQHVSAIYKVMLIQHFMLSLSRSVQSYYLGSIS